MQNSASAPLLGELPGAPTAYTRLKAQAEQPPSQRQDHLVGTGASSMIPNLPGYRNLRSKAKMLSQSLRVQHGYMMVEANCGLDARPLTAPSPQLSTPPPGYGSRVRDARDLHDLEGRYSIRSQARDRKAFELPYKDQASKPNFLKFDRKVLSFGAYFVEELAGESSAVERKRVRKCTVYYYLEDGTLEMTEPRFENSGLAQGALIRRHKVPKPLPDGSGWHGPGSPWCWSPPAASGGAVSPMPTSPTGEWNQAWEDPEYYGVDDLFLGAELEVYKKRIKIYDCDAFTRQFLERRAQEKQTAAADSREDSVSPHVSSVGGGVLSATKGELARAEVAAPLKCPRDEYETQLELRMRRETGADPSVNRNRRLHPMKLFMEAQLGKPRATADLGAFLQHDRACLRFRCVWDDTDRLYGDMLKFKLHYFLSDDTIEILNEKTSGRDPVPRLLGRRRLPLPEAQQNSCSAAAGPLGPVEEDTTIRDDEPNHKPQFYTWKDLQIGEMITVYNRELLLVDADPFTFEHYRSRGRPLSAPIKLEDHGLMPGGGGGGVRPFGSPLHNNKAPLATQVPPHDGYGFGSEEDSLRSVYSIRPKKPTRDTLRATRQNDVMRFSVNMKTDRVEDKTRLFTLQYYVADDTISIRELVIRNSGHLGGSFLSRGRVKKPHADSLTTPKAPNAGCPPIPINGANDKLTKRGGGQGPRAPIFARPPPVAYYGTQDLFIGNCLDILGQTFVVLDADEHTLRYMETVGLPQFPYGNVQAVLSVLPDKRVLTEVMLQFTTDLADAHQLQAALGAARAYVTLHAAITLARAARRHDGQPHESGPIPISGLKAVLGLIDG